MIFMLVVHIVQLEQVINIMDGEIMNRNNYKKQTKK